MIMLKLRRGGTRLIGENPEEEAAIKDYEAMQDAWWKRLENRLWWGPVENYPYDPLYKHAYQKPGRFYAI